MISRLDGQAYYDDVADLTWLSDANVWAAGLTVGGADGWRLPTTELAVIGLNQTGSEMGKLF